METDNELNLYDVPVKALRPSTRQIIVNELNKRKILASEDGLPRDWRGLAHLTGLPQLTIDNPAFHLLVEWGKQSEATLGLLEQYLSNLDRWDIVDDIYYLLREDAKHYIASLLKCSIYRIEAGSETDSQVLTYDDIHRLEQGLELQLYDALLLYADQDQQFAQQMLDRLENDYCLKVCLKENLVGGLTFEHQCILRLISERCRRVIIILSHNFFDSPVNQFFVSFAQALAIEKRQRIIIPCVYGSTVMELPQEIRLLHKLDYNRIGLRDYNFWERLRASIVQPPFRPVSAAIREITDSTTEHKFKEMKVTDNKAIKPLELKFMEVKSAICPDHKAINLEDKTVRASSEQLDLTGKLSSSSFLCETTKQFSSTHSLPEKCKEKSKPSSNFIRKLFRFNANKCKNQSKKIAVKL